MSLGVRSSWRVPKSPLGRALVSRDVLPSRLSFRSFATSTPTTTNNDRSLAHSSKPGSAPRAELGSESSTPSVSATLDQKTPKDANQSTLPNRPTSSFIERLAQIPLGVQDTHESILVRPMMEFPNKRETRAHAQRVHKDLMAQELHDRLQQTARTRLPDWRKLLEDMTLATPLYLDGIIEVHIPPTQARVLLSPDRNDSVWDITSRTGSYLDLEDRPRPDGSVILRISGPRNAIDKAITDIVNVTKKLKVVLLSNGEETILHDETTKDDPKELAVSPGPVVPVPKRRYGSWSRPPITLTTQASGVPKPEVWTKESFEEYVYTLTQGHMPNSLASNLYPKGVTHAGEVTKQLHRAFNNPAAKPAHTLEAFKMALKFVAQRGPGSRPDTRALFVRAEMNGMKMDTTVFNILADDCVNQKDLRNFTSCIYLMLRRGLEPNFRTWMLFLNLVENEQVKRYIFQAMHQRKLLSDPVNLAKVALEMAEYDADRAVRQGWDLQSFLGSQKELYGSGWLDWRLSHYTCNRIMDVLLKHSKFDKASEFLNFMVAHPCAKPDVVTLNMFLKHTLQQRKFHFAGKILARMEKLGIVLDSISLDHLFELFWHQKLPHSIDIIWQYAVLVLKTQYHMRTRIAKILDTGFRNGWDHKELEVKTLVKSEAHWFATFGLLLTSAKKMVQGHVGGNRGGLAKQVVSRGHAMCDEGWSPVGGLGPLLIEALEKDRRFLQGVGLGYWVREPMELPKEKSLSKREGSPGRRLPVDNESPVQRKESEDMDVKRDVNTEVEN